MPVNYGNMINGCECSVITLPIKPTTTCDCNTWSGRLNDLYFIPCDQAITEANLLDTAWWTALKNAGKLNQLGIGIGSFGKKNITTFDRGGCGSASVEQIEWFVKYTTYCIDKSTQFYNHNFADTIIKGALKHYNLVARYCDADEVILPIGRVDLTDFDNVVPESREDFMHFMYEFSFKGLYVPTPLNVPGLSTVVPKAS